MEYFDLSLELIEKTGKSVNWFRENKKNLIDYLFEEKLSVPSGKTGHKSSKDTIIYHFWTFSTRNPLPREIKEQLIEIWKSKQVVFIH